MTDYKRPRLIRGQLPSSNIFKKKRCLKLFSNKHILMKDSRVPSCMVTSFTWKNWISLNIEFRIFICLHGKNVRKMFNRSKIKIYWTRHCWGLTILKGPAKEWTLGWKAFQMILVWHYPVTQKFTLSCHRTINPNSSPFT